MRTGIFSGMTVMLVLALALPAAASDYTLEVLGNANEEEEGNEILETFYGVEDLYTEMLDLSDRFRWE